MRSERPIPRGAWRALRTSTALLLLCTAASAEVVERILAVVDGRPLLLTEVQLIERTRGVDRAAALAEAIDERLMYQEAARLPQAAASDDEVEQAYRGLLARLGPGAPPEADLRRLARRQTAILKYVDLRFRPLVRVPDDAVREAYEAEFGRSEDAPPFEAVAGQIRERLTQRRLDEQIEAWVSELRSAAEIRYNPS